MSSATLPHVVLVAVECKGLAKVGGLADVVADLSRALQAQGVRVTVVLPGYASIPPAQETTRLTISFGSRPHDIAIEETRLGDVPVVLVRAPLFFAGDNAPVYIDSAARDRGPFEDDAWRFAFFSKAVAHLLDELPRFQDVGVLHCHDWHTGPLLTLLRLTDRWPRLKHLPTLFTIHNLDYQGQRPLRAPDAPRRASLAGWYPDLANQLLTHPRSPEVFDPVATECYSPMRAAIRLADHVNTVSTTYASEIQRADEPARSFVGGRGLEDDLAALAREGRLSGILNGIYYEEYDPGTLDPPYGSTTPDWQQARAAHKEALRRTLSERLGPPPAPDVIGSLRHVEEPRRFADTPLIVAVTRLAGQKMSLLFHEFEGHPVLSHLAALPVNLLILGTGELGPALDAFLDAGQATNILHVGRFDAPLAARIYPGGDLFLMPSDFEPCGISQMIAMRYGTLPVATAVGGLRDTITDGATGYLLPAGGTRDATASALLETLDRALRERRDKPHQVAAMQVAAMGLRTTWEASARGYLDLYRKLSRSAG